MARALQLREIRGHQLQLQLQSVTRSPSSPHSSTSNTSNSNSLAAYNYQRNGAVAGAGGARGMTLPGGAVRLDRGATRAASQPLYQNYSNHTSSHPLHSGAAARYPNPNLLINPNPVQVGFDLGGGVSSADQFRSRFGDRPVSLTSPSAITV